MKKVGRPKGTTKIKKPIFEKEYTQLINFTKGDDTIYSFTKDKYIKTFTLLFYTGCRISELRDLNIKDLKNIISTSELCLKNNTKTKKPRIIYFSDNAVKTIQKVFKNEISKDNENELLIHTKNKLNDKVNCIGFTVQMNSHIQRVLGELYSTHSFRQGLITEMAIKGINTKIIQKFIGHSSIGTTLRYVTPTEDDIKMALQR